MSIEFAVVWSHLAGILLAFLAPAHAIFLAQQNISADTPSTYCGFYGLQRYRAWCDANISAFVASNKVRHPDWAIWKTMAIIWSILGFTGLLMVIYWLLRWLLRRRARDADRTPVTALSDLGKEQIKQEAAAAAAGQFNGSGAAATVTLWPTTPDGKPILAYGTSYPPQPPLIAYINGLAAGGRLAPNVGDALLQAATASRPAYNGPPMRTPPVNIPPLTGVVLPPPPPPGSASPRMPYGSPVAAGAEDLPLAAAAAAAGGGEESEEAAPETAAAEAAAGGSGDDGALMPPPAATLHNPGATSPRW
ncbi:hypothetical protein VOLCADRAFT_87214 [Volvox carteri f. nagariensis]|uniref:Uncharacterized protein n=1 Tax=Volvox carteri f. nagariensis TaxID=3068 RepID=D8TKG7_VOLCA|nr:uncharacterized protein VOLCADRAFT_87214 [Volvox carteri f. nagariensis]EFJ52061.1 hypothetical protein VOLCADRAFT_87214 [Volvox carteri f. nagariensis]|eukprot:XP_002946835.1 hypothetical protein VOLCADRAFT_87214 [Volvox carteri f. nagariensis]